MARLGFIDKDGTKKWAYRKQKNKTLSMIIFNFPKSDGPEAAKYIRTFAQQIKRKHGNHVQELILYLRKATRKEDGSFEIKDIPHLKVKI